MKKNIINLLILIALIVLIVLKLKENKQKAEERVYHYDRNQPVLVHTMKLSAQPVVINKDFTGNITSDQDGKINADVQGKVIELKVDEGDFVKKGQLLIKLDPTLLIAKRRALDVKIKGLRKDVQRYKVLVANDAVQAIKLEKAELGLRGALAERRSVTEQIKKTNIHAPFDGYITMKFTEVGSFAAPGMPLLQLTALDKLQFTVNVSEDDLDLFEKGKDYPVSIDAYPGEDLTGKLSMIGSKANRSNDYPVKFDLKNNKEKSLKVGMFGIVKVSKDFGDNAILVPATAIRGSEESAQVYVVQNGKAVLKNVVVKTHVGNDVIVEGLNDGDEIVTSGFVNLFDGANITTVEK